MMRRVRIIVNDPYATDDSSSDEWIELPKPPRVKRIVHEINLPCQLSQDRFPCRKKSPRRWNVPFGVRLRKSGKYAAEIRHPITRAKIWLGTYETVEEATKAFADKKAEYDALLASPRPSSCSSSVVTVNSQCLHSPSYTSVPAPAPPPSVNADDLSKEKICLHKDVAACGDSTKEVLSSFDFSDLQIPDLSFLAADEESMASGANGGELDFDCFLKDVDNGHLLDDFSLLDNDINIRGLENSVPSELPDYDFTEAELELDDLKFALADQLTPSPLNIPLAPEVLQIIGYE